MTQEALVTQILDNGYAVVSVKRGTACGGNCESCGGTCSFRSVLSVTAKNTACACVGDNVLIESSTKKILGAAALVYLLPLAAFFIGYFGAHAARLSEAYEILISLAALIFGAAAVVFINRKLRGDKALNFEIIGIC